MDGNALLAIENAAQLSAQWLQLLEQPAQYQARIRTTADTLAGLRGAVARHLAQLSPLLPQANAAKADGT